MITFTSFASGSRGNIYTAATANTKILLDCGISKNKLMEYIKLSSIDGCFITHEHQDHCKSVGEVIKRGIPTYMTAGTAEALGIDTNAVEILHPGTRVKVSDDMSLLPFSTHHDAREPCGCILQDTSGDALLYATDTYYLDGIVNGLTTICIECNHSYDILKRKIWSGANKKLLNRITHSHLALETLLEWLIECDLSRCREIYLLHMSDDNGDADGFRERVEKVTGVPTIIC